MKLAVLDLGTNTFNLLIAENINNTMHELVRKKRPVKIGKDGLAQHIIAPDAYQRALDAIQEYKIIIEKQHVDKIKIVATSAFRTTDNGLNLSSDIEKILQTEVKIIDGDKEATYIYDGIRAAVPLTDKKVLMLDIGGGSNELIIANRDEIFWKHSFKLGISRLIEMFKPEDPLSPQDIYRISTYIQEELVLLKTALSTFPTDTLVGSSGTFDTIANMMHFKQHQIPIDASKKWNELNLLLFFRMLDMLIISSFEQRKNIVGMDMTRIEMIPVAALFVRNVIELFHCKRILHSQYAIKEGVWFDTMAILQQ